MKRKTLWSIPACVLPLLWAGGVQAATPIPNDDSFVVSLDGAWRFKLEQENGKSSRPASYGTKSPIELPETFEAFHSTDYVEDDQWHDLKVPGNWELQGYGTVCRGGSPRLGDLSLWVYQRRRTLK